MESGLLGQYIQGGVTVLFGLIGVFLPRKWNPFRFKKDGIGEVLSGFIPEKILDRIPKIIGFLLIFVGLFILCLTPVLGKMPW